MAYKELVEAVINADWVLGKIKEALLEHTNTSKLFPISRYELVASSKTMYAVRNVGQHTVFDQPDKWTWIVDESLPFAIIYIRYIQEVDIEKDKLLASLAKKAGQ